MSVLSPTSLETTDYGQQGWNAVHSANMQKLNDYLKKLWGPVQADNALGTPKVTDNSGSQADPDSASKSPLIGSMDSH